MPMIIINMRFYIEYVSRGCETFLRKLKRFKKRQAIRARRAYPPWASEPNQLGCTSRSSLWQEKAVTKSEESRNAAQTTPEVSSEDQDDVGKSIHDVVACQIIFEIHRAEHGAQNAADE